MEDIRLALKEIGARNGLEIALDENGACTLELDEGRERTEGLGMLCGGT